MSMVWVAEDSRKTFHIETDESAKKCSEKFTALCGAQGKANFLHVGTAFEKCKACWLAIIGRAA